MRFIELFDSGDKKRRLSHIKNLVALGCSDGNLDKDEIDLIFQIGLRAGLSRNELDRILHRPHSVHFHPPERFIDRIEQLYDMVLLMMIDGEIHENEIALCKIIAIKLGFRHEIIEKIIENIINSIERGIKTEIAIRELLRIFNDY